MGRGRGYVLGLGLAAAARACMRVLTTLLMVPTSPPSLAPSLSCSFESLVDRLLGPNLSGRTRTLGHPGSGGTLTYQSPEKLVRMLRTMEGQGLLPCLLFNFNRAVINCTCQLAVWLE